MLAAELRGAAARLLATVPYASLRETIANPWLDYTWIAECLAAPFQLRPV